MSLARASRSANGVYQRSTLGVLGSSSSICLCDASGAVKYPKSMTVTVAGGAVPTGVCIGNAAARTNFSICNLNGGRSNCLPFLTGTPSACIYEYDDPGSSYTDFCTTTPTLGTVLRWRMALGWNATLGGFVAVFTIFTPAGDFQVFDYGSNGALVCGGSITISNAAFYSTPAAGYADGNFYGNSATISAVKC